MEGLKNLVTAVTVIGGMFAASQAVSALRGPSPEEREKADLQRRYQLAVMSRYAPNLLTPSEQRIINANGRTRRGTRRIPATDYLDYGDI